MEILIKKILVSCLICFSIQLKAQTSEMKNVEDAFSSSYTLELKAEYNATMAILKTVYDEKSYEINLRLGWLNYLAGLFTESSAYYQDRSYMVKRNMPMQINILKKWLICIHSITTAISCMPGLNTV